MPKHGVTLIPGDGIGPEITAAMTRVVEATGVDIEWEVVEAGAGGMDKYGTPLPDHVIKSIRETKIALKGPITTPVGHGFRSVNVALRQSLDLYANLRPVSVHPALRQVSPLRPERLENVELINRYITKKSVLN